VKRKGKKTKFFFLFLFFICSNKNSPYPPSAASSPVRPKTSKVKKLGQELAHPKVRRWGTEKIEKKSFIIR